MASVQEPGFISFYAKSPSGAEYHIYTGSASILGPGGSADGVKASTSNADNQLFLHPVGLKLKKDWTLMLKTKTIATDGVDVSDCHIEIPVITPGGLKYLTRSDFANPTPVDYTSTAGIEQVFGGYLVTDSWLQLGGGFIFFSLEDDTA